jgi:hypothetical protein
MPARQDVLDDRRFWASLYACAFGQVGEPPEAADVSSRFGLREPETSDWHSEFTGWYPGIFDKSDGFSDDPATIRIALGNGSELRVEFHPGDLYWYLRGADGEEAMLANVGPHWALPGLRWQEAAAIAGAAPGADWTVSLLLLPVVWITAGDDVAAARRVAESAWSSSALLPDTPSAAALADLWIKAVEGGREEAVQPGVRSKMNVIAKNNAKAALKTNIRNWAKIVEGTATVTDAQKAQLGLNVRAQPSPIPPPATSPGLDVISVNAWTVKIRLHDTASSAKRGKPPGVIGAAIFTYAGAATTPPADIGSWQFEGNTGRTILDVSFPNSLAPGAKVWLTAFWFNGRKQSGPTTTPVSTNLPGGSVSMAA